MTLLAAGRMLGRIRCALLRGGRLVRLLLIMATAAALGGVGAAAHTRDKADKLNCPSASRTQRVQAIESRIEGLESRLEALDSRLEAIDSDRRQALDDAKARIEEAARSDSFNQTQLDAAVASALTTADGRAKVAAAGTNAAQAEITSVKAQMQALKQQLRALASRKPPEADRSS